MKRTYAHGTQHKRVTANLDHESQEALTSLQAALEDRFTLIDPIDKPSMSLIIQEALRRFAFEAEHEPGALVEAWEEMKAHGPRRVRGES